MTWPDLRQPERKEKLPRRLGWMALIWLLSVAALGTVAFVLRLWIR